MNSYLLNRALGSTSHQSLAKAQNNRLLHSIQLGQDVKISHNGREGLGDSNDDTSNKIPVAHPAGVNSITVDKFEGR